MKTIQSMLIFASIMLISLSCGKSEEDIKEEKYKAFRIERDKVDAIDKTNKDLLLAKYHTDLEWAHRDFMTYEYQRQFISDKVPMALDGDILDIIDNGKAIIVKISSFGAERNHLAEITFPYSAGNELISQIESQKKAKRGLFIFFMQKVIPITPKISADLQSGDDESDPQLFLDIHKALMIFKGNSVDFYLENYVERP